MPCLYIIEGDGNKLDKDKSSKHIHTEIVLLFVPPQRLVLIQGTITSDCASGTASAVHVQSRHHRHGLVVAE